MNGGMRRACVMGHPIAHSRSPMIHNHWLRSLGIEGNYDLQDVAPERFADFLRALARHGYVGGNVTLPHKEVAYRTVERRDDAAEAIGAVNTVWLEDGVLHGGNSDAPGLIANLDDQAPGWDIAHVQAVVLGAGGAARAAVFALKRRGVRVSLINRTLQRAQALAAHFGDVAAVGTFELLPQADLLVNCTSLGMVGKEPLVVDLAPLRQSAVVYDLIYTPLETPLLAEARRRGHRVVDGLGMLLHQAGYGFEKWFGAKPAVTRELRAMVEADLRAPARQS